MSYWIINEELDGVEVYFDDVPGLDIREQLKAEGWRWHRSKGCWYTYDSDDNEEFADYICNRYDDECDEDVDCNDEDEELEGVSYKVSNLIRCVDCGKMISPRASICIGCGAPMDYIKKEHEKLFKELIHKLEQQRAANEKRRQVEERKRQEAEKKREEAARLLQERIEQQRREQERKKLEEIQLIASKIDTVRKEFKCSSKDYSDAEMRRVLDFLEESATRLGPCNYKYLDGIVLKVVRGSRGNVAVYVYVSEEKHYTIEV